MLDAARKRFVDQGYEGASLRDISADAGVDVALVARYFGSKDELFREVLTSDGPPEDILQGGLDNIGQRLAQMFVLDPLRQCKIDKLLIILRSASSARAAEIIRRNSEETFYGPLETLLGGPDSAVQTRILSSVLTGIAILRTIDEDLLLNAADRAALADRVANMLQAIADERAP